MSNTILVVSGKVVRFKPATMQRIQSLTEVMGKSPTQIADELRLPKNNVQAAVTHIAEIAQLRKLG
jgi:hypothetical protein